jgi:hypothetical protein
MTIGFIERPDGSELLSSESLEAPMTFSEKWSGLEGQAYPGRRWGLQEGPKLVRWEPWLSSAGLKERALLNQSPLGAAVATARSRRKYLARPLTLKLGLACAMRATSEVGSTLPTLVAQQVGCLADQREERCAQTCFGLALH